MEEKLLGLDAQNPDLEELNAIFRCAHSIKGGSGAFGLDRITNFTHILEELLDKMREGKLDASSQVTDALLASVDIVTKMVEAAQNNIEAEEKIEDEVAQKLQEIAGIEANRSQAQTETK
jgi:Chemotaxis protein histidine kinase and related kinases